MKIISQLSFFIECPTEVIKEIKSIGTSAPPLHVANVATFLETLLRMFLESIDCVFVLQFSPRLSLYN